ncbi:MAG TPA: hypothetical protein VNM91_09250, partial [Dehalococcoidia bacterium]|nr:hypothetical protein [Dehalococcoidia bacterium]
MFRSATPPLPVLVLHGTLLLLAGPHVATAAAVAIVVIQTAIGERSPRRWLACAADAGAAAAAIQAAGWVYAATAGAFGTAWP